MSLLSYAYDAFWSERIWLPGNLSWQRLEEQRLAGRQYAPPSQLLWSIPVAVVLMLLRYPFNWYVCNPIAAAYGLKSKKPAMPTPNRELEAAYRKKGARLNKHDVQVLCKRNECSERELQRWMKRRAAHDRQTPVEKVHETLFYSVLYAQGLIHGIYVVWNKPWATDTRYLWYDYPPPATSDMVRYIVIQTGVDLGVVFWILVDVRRKDFVQSVVHHLSTIALLALSWCGGALPIAALTLVIHDPAPLLVQVGKTLKYLGFSATLCNVLFLVFAVTWFYTRLYLYPSRVIYSGWFEATQICGLSPALLLCHIFLLMLLVMHIIWAWMIVKTAHGFIFMGKSVEKDARSESEASEVEEEGKVE